jgi:hypothetical protein
VNDSPLAVQFPRLYLLTFQKDITVKTAKNEGWGVFQFRRLLYGETLQHWQEVRRLVDDFQGI